MQPSKSFLFGYSLYHKNGLKKSGPEFENYLIILILKDKNAGDLRKMQLKSVVKRGDTLFIESTRFKVGLFTYLCSFQAKLSIFRLFDILMDVMSTPNYQINIDSMEKAGPKAYDKIYAREINIHQLQTVGLQSYKFDTTLNGVITQKINHHLKESIYQAKNDLNLFFELQLNTIIDYLYLRCNMYNYFIDLISLRVDVKAELDDAPILEDLEDIQFMGFMILISKLIKDKKVYGSLLHQQGIPLPLFFKINKGFCYQPALCDLILGTKQYELIFNVESIGVKSKGKSLFIAKVMNKQESQISNDFEDSFYLHTQPLLQSTSKNQSKQIMLMDFNGSISQDNPLQVKKMIQITASLSSLIIIHLMELEIKEGILRSQAYLDLFGSRKPNVIIFLKDRPQTDKSAQANLEKEQFQKDIPFELFASIKFYALSQQEGGKNKKVKDPYAKALLYISEYISTFPISYLKLSLKTLNSEDKEKIKLFDKIQATIKPLEDKNFLKRDEACYLSSVENICRMNLELKKNKDIDVQQKIFEGIEAEKIKQSSFKPSAFITQTMNLISGENIGKQLYTQLLNKAKNTVIDPIKQEKRKIDPSKTKQLDDIQKRIDDYDINLDDIVNQFVGSSCYSSKKSEGAKKAQTYYRKCYEDMSPINIIDSNTLLFGNDDLEEFFRSIKIKFDDIFVVSIFGGQSSGKSTLLNYIFRSNFETSSGRCTKGVNISFCKIGQTLVVVLDTEGIMSTVARDGDFTLRIPTFVMMTSDLIIVTNRGQILDPFQKLMKDCLTILQNIRKSQAEKIDQQTHKMLIALISLPMRNASQTNVQDEFGTVLKRLGELQNKYQIKYKEYIDLTPDDIFSLPSLFEVKKSLTSQIQPINIFTDDYGKATLGMRSRINELIDKKKKNQYCNLKNLHDIYNHLQFQWNLLSKLDNLQAYEANSEKMQEQMLENTIKDNIDKITQIIKKTYRQISNNTYENVDQETLLKYLAQNKQISKKDFKTFLKKSVPPFIKDKIIDKCQSRFQAIYNDFVEKEIKIYKKYRTTKNDEEKQEKLKKIQNEVNKYLQIYNESSKEGFVSKQTSKIIESFKKQLEKIPLKPNIDNVKFKTVFSTLFYEHIISKNSSSFGNVSVNQCLELVQDIKTQQMNIDKFLKPLNNIKQQQLAKYYLDFRQQFKNSQSGLMIQLKHLINIYQIEIEVDIISKFNYFLDEIQSRVQKLEAKVLQDQVAGLKKQRVKWFFLGKVYQQTLANILSVQESQIAEINQTFTAQIKKHIDYVQQKAKQMEENAVKDLFQTLRSQSSSYFDLIRSNEVELRKLMRDNLINYYEKLKSLYTPEKMLKKALSLTLLCPQGKAPNSKAYYIDCYKIVKNPKRFIGEILINEPFYKLGDLLIEETIQKTIKTEKTRILQEINSFKDINESESFKEILQKCNMNVTSNKFVKQDLYSAGQLANQIFQILSKKVSKIEKQLQKILQNSETAAELKIVSKDKFKNVLAEAIGCEQQCPMCGMKCALRSHGSTPHVTLSECHSLTSFGGCSLRRNKQILTMLCQSGAKDKRWSNLSARYSSYLEMINSVNRNWKDDFPQFHSQHQHHEMSKNLRQLKWIWANIEIAMISTKFSGLHPTTDIDVKGIDREQQVTPYDLMQEVVDPEDQEWKIPLRNY